MQGPRFGTSILDLGGPKAMRGSSLSERGLLSYIMAVSVLWAPSWYMIYLVGIGVQSRSPC